jgi:hypothetical protein
MVFNGSNATVPDAEAAWNKAVAASVSPPKALVRTRSERVRLSPVVTALA